MERLLTEAHAVLAKLPDKLQEGLSSAKAVERLHAQLELRRSRLGEHLAELLRDSGLLPSPELMRVFVNTAMTLGPESLASWLIERAVAIGAAAAVAELVSYSTAESFTAREVIVLDGVRVGNGVGLGNGVRLEPLKSLGPTHFRDQFIASAPWQPPGHERAALVRTFDHPVFLLSPADDRFPTNILEIAQDEALRDVARLFTLLKGVAPAIIAHWWEHDLATPSCSPATGASVTAGFESIFSPFEVDRNAAELLTNWVRLANGHCSCGRPG